LIRGNKTHCTVGKGQWAAACHILVVGKQKNDPA